MTEGQAVLSRVPAGLIRDLSRGGSATWLPYRAKKAEAFEKVSLPKSRRCREN